MFRFPTRLASLIFSILLVSNCSGSNSQSTDEALQKQIESLTSQIDSLNNVINSSSTSSVVPAEATPNPLAIEKFSWAEVSDRVNALQDLLGVAKTGAYDDATWWSHVAYLVDFQLDTSIAPTPPVRDNPKVTEPPVSTTVTQPAEKIVREGGLVFNHCDGCGELLRQEANCSNWRVSVTNSSNQLISTFVFGPYTGGWAEGWEFFDAELEQREVYYYEARWAALTVTVNLAPGASDQFSLKICTTTPSPFAGQRFLNFYLEAPNSVEFVWSDGIQGRARFLT